MTDDCTFPDFRGLFDALESYEGRFPGRDVLSPWLADAGSGAPAWLGALAARKGNPIPAVSVDECVALYALSRVNDTLLLGFQPNRNAYSYTPPPLSLDEYLKFMNALGAKVVRETVFSPFFHEIVAVEQDAGAPVLISEEYWPALMLGPLMLSRAGVAVRSGRERIRKEVAEASTMYWAYRRRNRPRQDLSVGWGSNSQWSTSFRRDYHVGGAYYFNVDGTNDLSQPEQPDRDKLTPEARRELLLHRCFITVTEPADHCFPYEDTYRLPA